jgi:hypothetical protein
MCAGVGFLSNEKYYCSEMLLNSAQGPAVLPDRGREFDQGHGLSNAQDRAAVVKIQG